MTNASPLSFNDPQEQRSDSAPPCPTEFSWLWDLLTHPRVARYKRRALLVVKLLAHSGKKGTPGLLADTDGAIAFAVGLDNNLDALHAVLDQMRVWKDVRATTHEGVRRYEFSRDLVPEYENDPRLKERWDSPRPVMTVQNAPPHPLEVDAPPEGEKKRRGGNHKWEIQGLSNAATTAFSRYVTAQKAKAEREGRKTPDISRDKWYPFWLRSQAGETIPEDIAVTFEIDENGESKSYTAPSDVTFGTSGVTFASRDEDDEDDDKLHKENHHLHQEVTNAREAKVTEAKVTEAKVTQEELTSEQKEVHRFLSSQGIWPDVAIRAALWLPPQDKECYVFWVKSEKPDRFAGLMSYHLKGEHPIPDDARVAYANHLKQQRRDREKQEQGRAEREAREAVEAAWALADETERATLCKEAANRLRGDARGWWKTLLMHRKSIPAARPPRPLQAALDAQIEELIREQRGLPVRDKNAGPSVLPDQWHMPEGWNGESP